MFNNANNSILSTSEPPTWNAYLNPRLPKHPALSNKNFSTQRKPCPLRSALNKNPAMYTGAFKPFHWRVQWSLKKANSHHAAYLLPPPVLPTQSTPHQMHHQKVAMPVAKCAKLGGGAKCHKKPPKKKTEMTLMQGLEICIKNIYYIMCVYIPRFF